MSHLEHQHAATTLRAGFAVVTLSDTRTRDTDTSGKLIRERLTVEGHELIADTIIRDEPMALDRVLDAWLAETKIDVILTNGGTGLSQRDQTIDTLEPRLQRIIPGFGELFRALSHREIGSAAMLSRALAGVVHGKLIFALPGSTSACRLALDELIVPQLRHLLKEIRK